MVIPANTDWTARDMEEPWWRKCDWAVRHANEIQKVASDYLSPDSYELVRDFDAERSAYTFRAVFKEPIPFRLPFLIGDYVHNLRSALDHMMWAHGRRVRAKPDSHLSFPVTTNEDSWCFWLCKFRRQLHPEVIEVVHDFQPYKRGDAGRHPLAILNKLDVEDKHRLLLTVLTGQDAGPMLPAEPINGIRVDEATSHIGPFDDRTEIASLVLSDLDGNPLAQDPEVEMKPPLAFRIAFPASGPGFGKPFDEVLNLCMIEVETALRALTPALAMYPPLPHGPSTIKT